MNQKESDQRVMSEARDYERRFRGPERPFSTGTSRTPNHGHEHPMWKQDRYTLVQEKWALLALPWVQIESAEEV